MGNAELRTCCKNWFTSSWLDGRKTFFLDEVTAERIQQNVEQSYHCGVESLVGV